MATDILIKLQPFQIGLIVRGKRSEDDSPSFRNQHADCVLPSGDPIGVFHAGTSFGVSSMDFPSGLIERIISLSPKKPPKERRIRVLDYPVMITKPSLRYLVDAVAARSSGFVSTILLIDVSEENARRFNDFWKIQKRQPDSFYIFGRNCSTYASKAFQAAGILNSGIPLMDTPNGLYLQLRNRTGLKTMSYSGYIGFIRKEGYFKIKILSL
jgi:hypothetical protein